MTRKLTALTATLALLATGCSASTDNTAPTGSPATPSTTTAPAPAPSTATQTPTVTEVNPTTATPTVSLDPSPLAGTGAAASNPPASLLSTPSPTRTVLEQSTLQKQSSPHTPVANLTRSGLQISSPSSMPNSRISTTKICALTF